MSVDRRPAHPCGGRQPETCGLAGEPILHAVERRLQELRLQQQGNGRFRQDGPHRIEQQPHGRRRPRPRPSGGDAQRQVAGGAAEQRRLPLQGQQEQHYVVGQPVHGAAVKPVDQAVRHPEAQLQAAVVAAQPRQPGALRSQIQVMVLPEHHVRGPARHLQVGAQPGFEPPLRRRGQRDPPGGQRIRRAGLQRHRPADGQVQAGKQLPHVELRRQGSAGAAAPAGVGERRIAGALRRQRGVRGLRLVEEFGERQVQSELIPGRPQPAPGGDPLRPFSAEPFSSDRYGGGHLQRRLPSRRAGCQPQGGAHRVRVNHRVQRRAHRQVAGALHGARRARALQDHRRRGRRGEPGRGRERGLPRRGAGAGRRRQRNCGVRGRRPQRRQQNQGVLGRDGDLGDHQLRSRAGILGRRRPRR